MPRSFWQRITATKSMEYLQYEKAMNEAEGLERVLNLFDLIMIGIASTVGTGVFVLAGVIAAKDAGPAVTLSWGIAGFACVLTGFAYMELSSLVPSSGSVYAYSYVALGEIWANMAAWCLSLEYGISASAIARGWGSIVADTLVDWGASDDVKDWLNYRWCSVTAGLAQAACTALLLGGLTLSKTFVNYMTMFKITLVLFMTIAGFCAFHGSYLDPFIPPSLGMTGVLRGSTAAFFGYIGFDEVCCMAGETVDPLRVMPKAIVGTVIGTAVLSGLASLALVGMMKWDEIDPNSGFESAFDALGWRAAALITEVGEIVALPVVVFVSFLAQPRLQYAMAKDGLAPQILAKLDKNGNIFMGTLISGAVLTVVALCVPFDNLNDAVSAGVLISFIMCNCCVLNLRYLRSSPQLFGWLMPSYVAISLVSAFLWTFVRQHSDVLADPVLFGFAVAFSVGAIGLIVAIWLLCPQGVEPAFAEQDFFHMPCVPLLPCAAIYLNWFLISQLSTLGLILICIWLLLSCLCYACYGYHHSKSMTFTSYRRSFTTPKFKPFSSSVTSYDALFDTEIDLAGDESASPDGERRARSGLDEGRKEAELETLRGVSACLARSSESGDEHVEGLNDVVKQSSRH